MNTIHFDKERNYREQIVGWVGGAGNVVLTNVIDRGHKNGAERFELTDNAIIFVYNVVTNKLVTILFPRVGQLYSRFGEEKLNGLNKDLLRSIKAKCREYQRLGYNEL